MWLGCYGSGGLPMFIGGIMLWASIIALAAWVIHRAMRRHGFDYLHGQRKDPEYLLKYRYVRGEISKQEFEEIRRDLLG